MNSSYFIQKPPEVPEKKNCRQCGLCPGWTDSVDNNDNYTPVQELYGAEALHYFLYFLPACGAQKPGQA